MVASFLERHDLVVAKLAAFREKDVRFVTELAAAGLVDLQIARERLDNTALHPVARQRVAGLLETGATGPPSTATGRTTLLTSMIPIHR